MVLLRCHPIKISPFGWLPYPLKSLVHIHISRHLPPFLLLQEPSTTSKITVENSEVNALEVNTNDDIGDMDLYHFTHDTSNTPAPPLIEREFEKEWETVWEVFPELSDNSRDPAIVPLANHSTTQNKPLHHPLQYSLHHPYHYLRRPSSNYQLHQYNCLQ